MALYNESLIYWIWLSELLGIGPVTAKALLNAYRTPEDIYKACKEDLTNIRGVGNTTVELILRSKSLDKAEKILKECKKLDINILTCSALEQGGRETAKVPCQGKDDKRNRKVKHFIL